MRRSGIGWRQPARHVPGWRKCRRERVWGQMLRVFSAATRPSFRHTPLLDVSALGWAGKSVSRMRLIKFLIQFFCTILVLILALGIYAFWIEPSSLTVTRVTIPVEGLRTPIRAVLIGDVQPNLPYDTPRRFARIAKLANAAEPDVVLLVGDYVSHMRWRTGFVNPRRTTAMLGTIKAPMGTYAVLGNHDWFWNGSEMRRLLMEQGIHVLEDSAQRAEARTPSGDKALWIAGLNDALTQHTDIAKTLAQADTRAPVLLLTHTPDVFPKVPGRVALTLAGHTHGGQINLPFIGRPFVPSRFGARYAYGLITEQGQRMFVTSGTGLALYPVRFRVRPEIVVLELVAK